KSYTEGGQKNRDYEPYFKAGVNRVDALASVKPAEKGKAKPKEDVAIPKDDKAKPKEDGKAKKDDGKDEGKKKAKEGGQARATLTDEEALELLALILTAQQANAPPEVFKQEAGVKFWEAYKAAQAGNAQAAVKLLEEARAIHDKQRWVRLRKPQ